MTEQMLRQYTVLVEYLGKTLGPDYEVVLHEILPENSRVAAIANGSISGRSVGAPITNAALRMIMQKQYETSDYNLNYTGQLANGKTIRSSTMFIKDGGKLVGLLCINFYLNTPLSHLLDSLCAPAQQSPAVTETFAENTRELVVQSVEQARAQVMADGSILPSNKNREIVALLHRWNIFKIKDSVPLTAQALDISPNTVYLHLRNVRQEEDA